MNRNNHAERHKRLPGEQITFIRKDDTKLKAPTVLKIFEPPPPQQKPPWPLHHKTPQLEPTFGGREKPYIGVLLLRYLISTFGWDKWRKRWPCSFSRIYWTISWWDSVLWERVVPWLLFCHIVIFPVATNVQDPVSLNGFAWASYLEIFSSWRWERLLKNEVLDILLTLYLSHPQWSGGPQSTAKKRKSRQFRLILFFLLEDWGCVSHP